MFRILPIERSPGLSKFNLALNSARLGTVSDGEVVCSLLSGNLRRLSTGGSRQRGVRTSMHILTISFKATKLNVKLKDQCHKIVTPIFG